MIADQRVLSGGAIHHERSLTSARRTAFVTGASYGIGAAIATAFARDGFDLALADLDAGTLENTVAAVRGHGARAVTIAFDLRVQSGIEESMRRVLAELGLSTYSSTTPAPSSRSCQRDHARAVGERHRCQPYWRVTHEPGDGPLLLSSGRKGRSSASRPRTARSACPTSPSMASRKRASRT